MPRVYTAFEEPMKAIVQKHITRGKVDIFVTIDSSNADDFTKATNDIKDYADNLRNITNELDSAVKAVLASQEMKLDSAK